MIVYIFIWTPLLLEVNSSTNIGMTFLSFTFSIILFSKLFEVLIVIQKKSLYEQASLILLAQAISLIVVYFYESFQIRLYCFTFINGSFGFLMPTLSTMKSQMLSEDYRTLMMSVYKLPTYLLSIFTIILTILWSLDKVSTIHSITYYYTTI